MPPPYSGRLDAMRKPQLVDIARDMGVELPLSNIKFDIADAIRDALRSSHSLREDKRFSGLWDAMGSHAAATDTDSEEEAEGDDDDDNEAEALELDDIASDASDSANQPAVRRSQRRTPRKSLASSRALDSAADTVQSALAVIDRHAPSAASLSDGALIRRLARKSSTNLRAAANVSREAVVTAQYSLSNAWTLAAVLLGAEMSYLVSAAVPWKVKLYGPTPWLLRSTPTPAFTVSVPDFGVLAHSTFTTAVLRWTLLNIIMPLVFSLLVAYPQHQHQQQQQQRRRGSAASAPRGSVAAPSVVTFGIVRLSVVVLSKFIFRSATTANRHWTFDAVEGYPAISALGSAVALAFAAFEQQQQ